MVLKSSAKKEREREKFENTFAARFRSNFDEGTHCRSTASVVTSSSSPHHTTLHRISTLHNIYARPFKFTPSFHQFYTKTLLPFFCDERSKSFSTTSKHLRFIWPNNVSFSFGYNRKQQIIFANKDYIEHVYSSLHRHTYNKICLNILLDFSKKDQQKREKDNRDINLQ